MVRPSYLPNASSLVIKMQQACRLLGCLLTLLCVQVLPVNGQLEQQLPSVSTIPTGLYLVRGDGASVHFRIEVAGGRQLPEIGFYYVDDPDGRIVCRRDLNPAAMPVLDRRGRPMMIGPEQPDYLELALGDRNSQVIFRAKEPATQDRVIDKIIELPGDRFIVFYWIESGTIESWRYAAPADRPSIKTSIDSSVGGSLVKPWQASNAGAWSHAWQLNVAPARSAEPGLRLLVNALPSLGEDTYTVFPSGADFRGPPQSVGSFNQPASSVAASSGLLENDFGSNGRPLTVTHVRVETPGLELAEQETGPWLPLDTNLGDCPTTSGIRLIDPRLHGELRIDARGAIHFEPDVADPYWDIESHPTEPIPVVVQYRVTDTIDFAESRIWIGHGYYRRGQPDDKSEGNACLFLGGGGNGKYFYEGRKRFFQLSSEGKDIVLISQGCENKEFADLIFDNFAAGRARSIVSFNITTREQANDPRLASAIRSADTVWMGGGSQAYFLHCWNGTELFQALERATRTGISLGATSAGTAVLGHAVYVECRGDSINSSFALCHPDDERLRLVPQGPQGFPFSALSEVPASPLHRMLVDTHFVECNRMGRLATFAAMYRPEAMRGLGIDARTAVLIVPDGDDYRWTVYGANAAYLVHPTSPLTSQSIQSVRQACPALSCDHVHVLKLRSGTSLLLSEIIHAPPSYTLFILNGIVYAHANQGRLY